MGTMSLLVTQPFYYSSIFLDLLFLKLGGGETLILEKQLMKCYILLGAAKLAVNL
jgi:hypothetical protein